MKKKDTEYSAGTHLETNQINPIGGKGSPVPPSPERAVQEAKASVYRAAASVAETIRLVLIAGQRLNELRETMDGDFGNRRKEIIPDISERTLQSWQQCAALVLVYVPPPPFPSIADILETDETALSVEALEFRRAWDDWVGAKSLRQILSDDPSLEGGIKTVRAINGKLKGGTNAHDNRKDFPLFTANVLKVVSGHISHWDSLDEGQKNDIKNAFSSAILGMPLTLPRPLSRTYPFSEPWPPELTKFLADTIKKTLRQPRPDANDE